MGLEASEWTLIGRFMNSPGWSTQVMWVYEARVSPNEIESRRCEERSATIHWYSLEELRTRLREAYAIDSTTAIALHRLFGNFLDDF